MSDLFRFYVPFSKVEAQPDGTVIVEGPVSSETIDTEDEVVDYDAIKAAAADYMQFANMREMHDPHTASGTMLNLDFNDDARIILGRSHVVDPGAVKKVLSGVYKGYSIGGRKLAWKMEKRGGQNIRRLTKLWWGETSYVDRPANPDAVFTLAKRDWSEEDATVADKVAKAGLPAKDDGDTSDKPETDAAEKAADAPTADEKAAFPGAKPPFKAAKAKKTAKSAKARAGATLAKMAVLRKGGNKSVKHMLAAMEEIVCAISMEASEGDEEGVTALQAVLSGAQKFISTEAAEPDQGEVDDGTDGEIAPEPLMDEGDESELPVEMAAQIKSLRKASAKKAERELARLRKRAKANRSVLRKVAALANGKTPTGTSPAIAGAQPDVDPSESTVDPLAKTAAAIDDLMKRVGGTVSPTDLSLVKSEVLAALASAKEDLEKTIAAQPVGGGPLAQPDMSRFGGDSTDSFEQQALAKAMARITDPIAKEALGKFAATEQIRTAQGR